MGQYNPHQALMKVQLERIVAHTRGSARTRLRSRQRAWHERWPDATPGLQQCVGRTQSYGSRL